MIAMRREGRQALIVEPAAAFAHTTHRTEVVGEGNLKTACGTYLW